MGFSYLRSQTQERAFDYANLYNSRSQFGSRDWSDVLTLTWTPNLARSAERALALEVYLSYQQNRSISSPLTPESDLGSRDPFGGFLIRPLGFLFDFGSFPLDQALVENIRLNRPGSRRTPFNIEDPVQLNLVDQFRNNAYGLPGWSEAGGPAGRMRLYRENRYIAKANMDWQVDRYDRLRLGGEVTRFSIGRFESELAALGDAYLEQPGEMERLPGGPVGSRRRGAERRPALRQLRLARQPSLPPGHGRRQPARSAGTSTSGERRSMKRVEPSTRGRWSSLDGTGPTTT